LRRESWEEYFDLTVRQRHTEDEGINVHNEELHTLHFSPNKKRIIRSKRMRSAENGKKLIKNVVGKCEWKRSLGRYKPDGK
jgi:hypothetical protein